MKKAEYQEYFSIFVICPYCGREVITEPESYRMEEGDTVYCGGCDKEFELE